ncbi:MAG: alcohol-forming fatty acyl-CoA reductase, partial [Pseudonocardiales bacterium]|nr:alcohol-forming fatty acyl-CoA reductase [Pseudonocardiales bacterium]
EAVDALLGTRLQVVAGELGGAVDPLPSDLDVVLHCAGEVSFDPPVDEGFRTNLLGTLGLLEAVRATGAHPHVVHVSTAYVAGLRSGWVPEQRHPHTVDWRTEAAAAAVLGERADIDSREPAVLEELLVEARGAMGAAGPQEVAVEAERLRRRWVRNRLVEAGRQRAISLGWTDCYTLTKALAEGAVEQFCTDRGVPLSIVRPSIIESALERPSPAWIEGFKMAEPLILAFGRGELPEFPAAPDSVVDIVPVDHVVGAIIAVMSTEPPPGDVAYFHVSSGARNPLAFRLLYELITDYFDRHPFDMDERGAVRLPNWRFPGAEKVERLLVQGERAHRVADRALGLAPRSDRVRELARDLDRQKRRLDFLRRYLDLYRAYATAELHFVDDNTLALYRSLEPADQEIFAFDTADFTWTYYLRDVHFPSVTEPIRKYDVIRKRRAASTGPTRRLIDGSPGSAESEGVLAVFDLDGTLMSSNIIETYLWMRLPELNRAEKAREIGKLLRRMPSYIQAERRDRGGLLRAVYRRYAGAELAELDRLADEVLTPHVLERVSAAAVRRVREHREAGHRTLLLTGAVRPLTRPLAPLFDEIVAADLAVDERGLATGFLADPPLVGESRAAWLRRYAQLGGYDLSRSYAYADSYSDLPMLRAVGLPTAISPDVQLWREARRVRWPVELWRTPEAVSRGDMPVRSAAHHHATLGTAGNRAVGK